MKNDNIFTLEILKAKKGDSLILHYGCKESPGIIIIDGGPSGVFRSSLKPKLDEIKSERKEKKLPLSIDLIMVSHIDDDHIKGILELFKHTKDSIEEEFKIRSLWHNSFDDIIGNKPEELQSLAQQDFGLASLSPRSILQDDWKNANSKLILVSVPQGRQLANDARGLGIPINMHFDGLIMANKSNDVIQLKPDSVLTFKIVSPSKKEVESLQNEWDKILKEKNLGKPVEVVEYLDKSVPNLASLVALVEMKGKQILFTGDARGDLILRDLKDGGYINKNGNLMIDVLKLPHHGSSNNVEQDFFDTIIADHYIISGDGSHGNPNVETFQMIFDSRRKITGSFNIHLTYKPSEYKKHKKHNYPVKHLEDTIASARNDGLNFEIIYPKDGEYSHVIELL